MEEDEVDCYPVTAVERLEDQLTRLRKVIAAILALAKELKGGTIESVLAKSAIELALEFLSGKRKLSAGA